MSEKENAVDFFQNYLPEELLEEIDLQSLELQKDSFVSEELKESFSDLLYKVKLQKEDAFLYTLFEHKSKPYRFTAFQLLKYMVSIWERELKSDKKSKYLPIILPMVFYHGKYRWRNETNFHFLIKEAQKFREYVPHFAFHLFDLSLYSHLQIKGGIITRVSLELLKNIFSDNLSEKLPSILSLLEELTDEKTSLRWLEIYMRYLFRGTDKIGLDKIEKITENIKITGVKNAMPTIAETLERKGELRGIQKERRLSKIRERRALRKEKLRTAIKMFQKGSELDFICEVVELDRAYLNRFFQRIGLLSK